MNRYNAIDAETIAGGLRKAKRVSPGKYVACCPSHDDKTPSFSIQDAPNGKILVHCYAGCSQDSVLDALRNLGLWYRPSRHHTKRIRQQISKGQIRHARMLLALAASENEQGIMHSEFERAQIRRAIRLVERHSDG
ncbi:MAG: hypothetical protein GY792_10060 [Gammaproteobacteria bacterium]|nr:hypothetical protein [Gammaproteobacteria bacterium]